MSFLSRGLMRFRMLARRGAGRIAATPFVGLDAQQLSASHMAEIQKNLFNKPLTGQAASDQLRAMARLNDQTYKDKLRDTSRAFMSPIADMHVAEFGNDPSKWTDLAKGRVYVSSLSDVSAGHSTLIASIERRSDPKAHVSRPGSGLDYVHSFINSGYATSAEQYLKILLRQRELDGTPVDAISAMMPDIMKLNAQYRKDGTDPECSIQLGSNSSIYNERSTRVFDGDMGVATDLMVTRPNHIFDGGALWGRGYFDRLNGAVVTWSLHFGEHPIEVMDPINDMLAVRLFKTNNTRGTLLAELRDKMVKQFGEDRANLGLFDPEIRTWYESQLDWQVAVNSAILACGDTAMGNLFQVTRLFAGPGTVATFTPAEIEALKSEDDLPPALDKAEKVTVLDGYTGPPTTVPPDASTPVLAPSLAANFSPVFPDLKSMPYLPVFQTAADALNAAGKDLPKSVIIDQVKEVVTQQVQEAVQAIPDAASKPVADVVKAIDSDALRAPMVAATDSAVVSSMAATPAFTQVAADFGATSAMLLVTTELSQPMWAQMTAPTTNLVEATIEGAVAVTIKHQLDQQAGDIQSRLSKAVDQVKQVTEERQKLQDSLKQVTDALSKKPDDQSLIDQQKDLKAKLEDAERAITEAEDERSQAEDDQSANEDRAREAEDAADAAEKAAKEHEAQISGDLMKVGK